ncbi:MAG: glycerophosphodiester phosphodiesterase [Terriglobales bacterium]
MRPSPSATVPGRPLLLGHRGARREAQENTFPAFDLCLARGADGFEFDVRRTADGRAVVFHDPALGGLEIAEHAHAVLRDRFQKLHSTDLPCLEEVLGRYASRAFLDIELKVAGLEDAVVALVQSESFLRGYVVSSFLPEVVESLRRCGPEVPTGFICDQPALLPRWKSLPADVLAIHRSLIRPELVADAQMEGKRVFAWSVNQAKEMHRLAEMGADALISDDPGLLCRTISAAR